MKVGDRVGGELSESDKFVRGTYLLINLSTWFLQNGFGERGPQALRALRLAIYLSYFLPD